MDRQAESAQASATPGLRLAVNMNLPRQRTKRRRNYPRAGTVSTHGRRSPPRTEPAAPSDSGLS